MTSHHDDTEIIRAPSRAFPRRQEFTTVFLAGTTTMSSSSLSSSPSGATAAATTTGDWRAALCARLDGRPLTIYDPRRDDWGAGDWREDATCAPFADQTNWELARAEAADLVVFYFGAATDAPVSLLELGLVVGRRYASGATAAAAAAAAAAARASGRTVIVCVDPAYRKKGNVQMVCQRYGVELVYGFDDLAEAVVRSLEGGAYETRREGGVGALDGSLGLT